MIETASMQFNDTNKYRHLHFIHNDVQTLSSSVLASKLEQQDQKQIDLVFSNAALHWVPETDIEQAIRSMTSTIKVGGRFVCEFGGKNNVQCIVSACYEARQKLMNDLKNSKQDITINAPPDTVSWYFPSISEFTMLLEKYDIEVLIAELYDRPTPLIDGINGLRNWITMFGEQKLIPSIVVSDNTLKQQILNQFFQLVEDIAKPALFSTTEQQWIADYRRIRIVGVKKK
jgi:trans-aconitate methyltransferase